jgi:hypothetical protein
MTASRPRAAVDHAATERKARVGALPDQVRAAQTAIDAVLRFLDKRPKSLLFLSLFLVLIGSRAAAINYAGNSTPLGDEWDGEAASLLKPYIEGKLTVADLFAPHNEHVIFFTRLLTLAVFNISGYWDVVLQMIANAILDAATVVGISYALSRGLRGGWAPAAMILSALMNAPPLSHYSDPRKMCIEEGTDPMKRRPIR